MWALGGNNPKRMLLLAVSLLGATAAIEGSLVATVEASSTVTGLPSKQGSISEDLFIGSNAEFAKKTSKNFSNTVRVMNPILGVKTSSSIFEKNVFVYTEISTKRPNYYKSNFNDITFVGNSGNGIKQVSKKFSDSIKITRNFRAKKRSKNTIKSTVLVVSRAIGIKQLTDNFTSYVSVYSSFKVLQEFNFTKTACIHPKYVLTREVIPSMNNCNKKIIIGQSVSLQVIIKDTSGNLVDPTSLTLIIKTPAKHRVEMELEDLIKTSVGTYVFEFTPDRVGTHLIRWVSTDSYVGVGEDSFYVNKSTLDE